MALAFVRQRHGLTNGDFDRTKRQQAVIDSVTHQLRSDGVLNDLGKLNDLLSVAKQYLITDSGWNLLDFISQMRGLSLGNVTFRTLPEVAPITIDGQDANQINVPQIQQIVQQAFNPAPAASASASPSAQDTAANSQVTVDVYNGGNTPGLAAQVSAALVKEGYTAGKVGNTSPLTTTEVLYGTGASGNASKIASMFNVTAAASSTLAAGHVEVMLGADATLPSGAASSSPSPSASSAPPSSTAPGAGTVNAKNGIPCVN
jgi:hypothetical protein